MEFQEIHFRGGTHWNDYTLLLPVQVYGYLMQCPGCGTIECFSWNADKSAVDFDEALTNKFKERMQRSAMAAYN